MLNLGLRWHSKESTHIRVLNDILVVVVTDTGSHILLLLLDFSTTFDTVDHNILIQRLELLVGIKGALLNLFRSYITDRYFRVCIDDSSSPSVPLPSRVPQVSLLGPQSFSIYLTSPGTDNCKIKCKLPYLCWWLSNVSGTKSLKSYSSVYGLFSVEVKNWLTTNTLLLNDDKTYAILLSPKNHCPLTVDFSVFPFNLKSCVMSLGVKLEAELTLLL